MMIPIYALTLGLVIPTIFLIVLVVFVTNFKRWAVKRDEKYWAEISQIKKEFHDQQQEVYSQIRELLRENRQLINKLSQSH